MSDVVVDANAGLVARPSESLLRRDPAAGSGKRVEENAGEIWGNVMKVMNATKAMVVGVGLLLVATPANLQAYDKSAEDEAAALKPLVRQFVREGYHSVPDWLDLGEMARALILKRGYRDENIAEIAREAAIANGMSK